MRLPQPVRWAACHAGTDWKMNAELLSYSRSNGLFAGINLDGTTLLTEQGRHRHLLPPQHPSTPSSMATWLRLRRPSVRASSGEVLYRFQGRTAVVLCARPMLYAETNEEVSGGRRPSDTFSSLRPVATTLVGIHPTQHTRLRMGLEYWPGMAPDPSAAAAARRMSAGWGAAVGRSPGSC